MFKVDILDDCNFGSPDLLHVSFSFNETCCIEFQFKFSFQEKNFSSIQDVMKIWHAF